MKTKDMLNLTKTIPITVFLIWLFDKLIINVHFVADTNGLVRAARAINVCVEHQTFLNCSAVTKYPLFQHLLAIILFSFDLSDWEVLEYISWFNTTSFFFLIVGMYLFVIKISNRNLAIFSVLILLTSPLLHYSRTTFNETAFSLFSFLFIISILLGRSILEVSILSVFLVIQKETSLPLMVILVGLAALSKAHQNEKITSVILRIRNQIFGFLIGASIGLLLNTLFNLFRYASLENSAYMEEALFGSSNLLQIFSNFLGLWLSPNGGMLFSWFSATFLIVSLVIVLLKKESKIIDLKSLIIIITFPVLITLGAALWWAPFGWHAWGPRLMIPWIPSIIALLFYSFTSEITQIVEYFNKSRINLIIWLSIFFVGSLANIAALISPSMEGVLFELDNICPTIPFPQDHVYYYTCLNHYIWTKKTILFHAFDILNSRTGYDYLMMFLILFLGVFVNINNNIPSKTNK
jgi:hypothetical protein